MLVQPGSVGMKGGPDRSMMVNVNGARILDLTRIS
jgi:hypothetical protein